MFGRKYEFRDLAIPTIFVGVTTQETEVIYRRFAVAFIRSYQGFADGRIRE